MLSLSVLLINKNLWRAEAFSGIFTNLLKQNLEIIKFNNLKKNPEQESFIFHMEETLSKSLFSNVNDSLWN